MKTEKEILVALHEGNQAAFEYIYKQMHTKIFLVARRYVSSDDDAKDIRSNCFMRLWEMRDNLVFSTMAEVSTWLCVSAKNRAIDNKRTLRMHEKKEDKVIDAYLQDNDKYVFEIADKEAALLNRLLKEIESLPPKVKTIFKMRWLDDLLFKEIAAKLMANESTVKKRYARAVYLLRKHENIKLNGKRKHYYTIPMLCFFG